MIFLLTVESHFEVHNFRTLIILSPLEHTFVLLRQSTLVSINVTFSYRYSGKVTLNRTYDSNLLLNEIIQEYLCSASIDTNMEYNFLTFLLVSTR